MNHKQSNDARQPEAPRRILLVRLSAIGDIVFSSPLIAAFRSRYPDAYLAWLAQPACRPLLEHHPGLDEVIEAPINHWRVLLHQHRWRELLAEIREMRRTLQARHFDLAVDLQGLLKSGGLARLSGAQQRIGLGSREGSQWLMTRTIPRDGPPKRIGAEYLYLAETLGLPVDGFPMAIHYTEADDGHAAEIIANESLGKGYAVICPFTTRPQKHWIEDRWPPLAERLGTELGLPTIMLGGPDDREAAERISAAAPGVVNLVGRTSLLQAAALIDHARLMIGVDTGLSHMGIAFNTPSLLLFGSTCPYLHTTRPNARVLYHRLDCSPCRRRPTCGGAFTCMAMIDVDQIIDQARGLLEASA